MSLNNVILPDLVISSLYKNSLFDIHQGDKPSAAENKPALQYLGKHLQRIAVFVYYPKEIYLPEVQLNFLASILKACNLNIADIAIINTATQQVTAEKIDLLNSDKVIFFDVDPASVHIDTRIQVFSIEQDKHLLLLKAPALEKLNQGTEEGKLLKSKLWLCLKELFSVK